MSDALRAAMGHFATGVTVVTASGRDRHGSTVNAITSVSLDPPLLLVCLRSDSHTLAALLESGRFGVNVLHETQQAIARRFARRGAAWDGVGRHEGPLTGAPLVDGALATFECAVHDVADGGDHQIVIAPGAHDHARPGLARCATRWLCFGGTCHADERVADFARLRRQRPDRARRR